MTYQEAKSLKKGDIVKPDYSPHLKVGGSCVPN